MSDYVESSGILDNPKEKDFGIFDYSTGEIIGGMNYGDIITSREELQRRAEEKQKRLEHEATRYRSNGRKYYFVKSDSKFNDISPAMVTRLIYLSTYVGYGNSVLMLTAKTKMKRVDLQDILGLSKRHTVNFWKEVNSLYVSEDENGYLVLNDDMFKRGKLKRKQSIPYQQFYIDGVRKLYEAASVSQHKQLGYLFSMLPYISVEYNLLCHNPYEKDMGKVKLMSIAEFCNEIGYSISNVGRLKRIYNAVRFDVDGRQERFCTMIYNGLDENSAKICINPNVLYAGTNEGCIEVSKLYFRD